MMNENVYSEVYAILNSLGTEYMQKVPKNLIDFIDNKRNKNYYQNFIFDDGSIDSSKLSNDAVALFAVINLKYFIKDEKEKAKWYEIFDKNEQEYQKSLKEKYNYDNLFENKKTEEIKNEFKSLTEYKEKAFIQRVIDKIKSIFK